MRGYGLVDSAKVKSEPGKIVNLTATPAPTPKAAAEIYPAIYWYSMLQDAGRSTNSRSATSRARPSGSTSTKTNGCYGCHALGNKATRTIPPMFADMKPEDAWARRILSGQAMNNMATSIGRIDTQRALKLFADWTDRVAAGELPAAKPQRPQGRERNVVITQWDFSDPKHYLHDITATDKRKPTLNANGLIYGAVENSTDLIPVLDPVNHKASTIQDAGARSEDAVVQGRSDVAVALLGRRGDLGQPDQHAQPDVRREGPGLVHLARRPAAQSGFLQEGLRPSVGQGVPAGDLDAASGDGRSEDRQDHADPHLLSRRTISCSPRTPTTRCG